MGAESGHDALTSEFSEASLEWFNMNPGRDEAVECDQLFVYGTLRRGFRLHYHLIRIGASYRADGRVAGELFDLGNYPGARPIIQGGAWVLGELFHLQCPLPDLKVLDQVEEFVPTDREGSEFIRAVTEVIQADGQRQSAWIYWLSKRVEAKQRIDSGDYATRWHRDPAG